MKPRVFVSSVVDGFTEFRQAAREGIITAGGEPVLLNEDFPSMITSSRNACLDAVESCDYVVTIIGARGGWTTPSGRLVVEEEYDRARSKKIPVLVFLQNVERDAEANRFARELSDYVAGALRRTFDTPEDLRGEVESALRPLMRDSDKRRGPKMSQRSRDYFSDPYRVAQTTMLRFALAPERDEEVFDPVRLESQEFKSTVYRIAHSDGVGLLSYENPKVAAIKGDALVIEQTSHGGHHGEGYVVRLEITEAGELIIDSNVTGRVRRGSAVDMLGSMVVALEDIETVLAVDFQFAAALYAEFDPFLRHQRFTHDVGLSDLGYRTLERNPKARSSYTMSMRDRGVIRAFGESRLISRADLSNPKSEIERAVTLLVRKSA
ncbi:MAG TPA: DUF4062 domain-containing protein [Gemmatimonadaceae bacterium]|nr:DUF4062 domain-containing protein [Gemmatimonadaceae bacterium]